MLIPGTPLYEEEVRGEFEELDANELLAEAYGILKGLNMTGSGSPPPGLS